MLAATLTTALAPEGSPIVFTPGPLLPAEMNSCTPYLLIRSLYSLACALVPSLSEGRPPIDMLTTSTPRLMTRSDMPVVSATLVQPPPHEHARDETILAPGAWPSNAALPSRSLPA